MRNFKILTVIIFSFAFIVILKVQAVAGPCYQNCEASWYPEYVHDQGGNWTGEVRYWSRAEHPDPSARRDRDSGGGGGGGDGGGSGGGGSGGCDPNSWGAWSACSTTCGLGTQTRTNNCGQSQTQNCQINDPQIGGTWSECSKPCDSGIQSRTNQCRQTQTQTCNTFSCYISYPTSTPFPPGISSTGTLSSGSAYAPPWFKTENGDVHSNKDIIVSLPSLLERFSDFLVTVKNLSSFAAGSDNDARPELASKRNWYWYSPPYGQVSYPELTGFFSYYTHNKPADKKLVVDNINNVLVNSLAGNKNLVRVQVDPTGGSVAISDSIGLSGDRQLVFYINGDLNINNNIILTDDSGVVFVVKGNLNIDASVTQTDGFYLVDKVVNSSYPGNGNKPLVVHGAIFASQSGKIFGSSRQNNDRATPAEKIIFEPKYLVKFSQVLGRAGIVWQEVAP